MGNRAFLVQLETTWIVNRICHGEIFQCGQDCLLLQDDPSCVDLQFPGSGVLLLQTQSATTDCSGCAAWIVLNPGMWIVDRPFEKWTVPANGKWIVVEPRIQCSCPN